ncbi:hypothetical protein [Natronomonas sp.]|uniref:hypothetical protein n=1 Tax=Natronomonas sp. TaxID=2184060 RepID=UPI002FC32047
MARASRPMADPSRGLLVHNEGPSTTDVHIVVHAAGVSTETVTLTAGETHTLAEPVDAPVEVHTNGGMATAFGGNDPLFVVRDGSVMVAPK